MGRPLSALFQFRPVKGGTVMHKVQREVQALLLDSKGQLPPALMDEKIIAEALEMRDRIGTDYALIYLQFKGMSLDKAIDALKTRPSVQ